MPQTLRTNLDLYSDYYVTVDTATVVPGNQYSSFSLQAHSQLYLIVLTNFSSYCQTSEDIDCTAVGSNVGLVQVEWNADTTEFLFRVRVECGPTGDCMRNSSVRILLATVAIPTEGIMFVNHENYTYVRV